jgi:para-nitrobenzyl esterase
MHLPTGDHTQRRLPRPVTTRLVAALILAASAILQFAAATPRQEFLVNGKEVIRGTAEGPIRGAEQPGLTAFLGIPFAAPPVGKLRFMAPAPVSQWRGIRDARHRGPACPQIIDAYDASEDGEAVQSEDCLTLNVWAPEQGAAHHPVMVFIHGGSLMEGSAADSFYDGAELARRGNVVVVTLQYRLGVLGFLYLNSQAAPGQSVPRSNAGIYDQIAALQWIQRNIASFSGDPGNVTLFGESSGGASIRALLVAKQARGLFHKVIIESGDTGPVVSVAKAKGMTTRYLGILGVRSVAQLQALPVDTLLKAQQQLFDAPDVHATFGLIDDGSLFNGTVIENVEKDPSTAVPMLIGSNTEELRYFIAMVGSPIDQQKPQILSRNVESFLAFKRAGLDGEGARVVERYRRDAPSDALAAETLLSDALLRIPSIRLAEQNSPRAPTYFYSFAYRSPIRGPSGLEYGAMHGIELPFVFHVTTPGADAYVGPRGTWEHLADQVVAAWSSFARTGNPNNDLLPPWPAYDAASRMTMELNIRSHVALDPMREERLAWEHVPSFCFEDGESIRLIDVPPGGE